MSTADFASLVALPDIIDGPGNYITRCGEVVTIYAVSKRNDFACRGQYIAGGEYDSWHRSGSLYFGIESRNDIVSKA